MGRGVEKDALQNSGTANDLSKQYNQNAQSTYGVLAPQLTAEATNPQGYSPTDLAAMNTASQQSIGGATAGAVGQGNLEAARTRNAGGMGVALDAAAQSGQRQLSQNALGIQADNANLKQKQQQAGLSGLEGLYSGNTGATLGALGLSNQALGQATGASNNTNQNVDWWTQQALNAAGGAAGAV